MKSRLVIILFMLLSVYIMVNTAKTWQGRLLKWDQSGYQLYLPAVFIYNDVTKLEFYSYIDSVYQPSGEHKNYCIYTLDNGNRMNRYSVGPAVQQVPFFIAAHFINTLWLHYPADGYSLPYQWCALLSNLFWVTVGLFVLRRFLLQYFTDNIAAITLLLAAFGTNLYYYAAFSAGGAHGVSFFQISLVLLYTDRLYRSEKKKYFYLLAIVFGVIGMTRPVNLLALLVPLLWGINNVVALKDRTLFLQRNLVHIAGAAIVFVITLMPQTGLWKYVTGNWYYDGYPNEGFIWTEPRIWQGLFSFQKGWLIYAPISIFALWGIYSMRVSFRQHMLTISLFLAAYIYVTYCWWNWWYGGCFGSRPMVDITALLCLPLAAFIERGGHKNNFKKMMLAVVCSLLIALNMFQSYQYSKFIIHPERMTAKYYRAVFLQTEVPTADDEQYLMTGKEYFGEMNHRNNQVSNSPD